MPIILRAANTDRAKAYLKKIRDGMTPEKLDELVADEAAFTLGRLKRLTPKRFFGQVRQGWVSDKPGNGIRTLTNLSRIMNFLEEGTRAHGPKETFGPLLPGQKRKRAALFIPLTRKAALANRQFFARTTVNLNNLSRARSLGNRDAVGPVQIRRALIVRKGARSSQRLIYGIDYVLAKRVRGIKAMHIVRNERPLAQARLKQRGSRYCERLIRG